jgi:transglutaminase-like putative cysteine protease
MKVKGAMILVILFCFGFFYQTTVFAKVFPSTADPFVETIGHVRTKEHGLLTVLSYFMINTLDQHPFLAPSDVIESDHTMIQQLAKELTQGKESDIEKSKAIYSWITENIAYDADYYYKIRNLQDFDFDSALETLKKGKSLCMGFAHLNAALHRSIGIEAKVVYGEDHAWNEVLLDGVWYSQDSTKGAGYIDGLSKKFVSAPTMEYFSVLHLKKEGEYLW